MSDGSAGQYDAIVIGAGPAGCTVARVLSERGRRVLLVERKKLPRYKSCSGALIGKAIALTEKIFGAIPSSVTCTPVQNRGMVFTDEKGRTHTFAQEGLNVWRDAFDGFLARSAEHSGAHLRDGVAVTDLRQTDGEVSVELCEKGAAHRATAQYAFDCSGSASTCKRQVLGKSPQTVTTFQAYCDGTIDLDPHYFYAWTDPAFSQYDAWFNVKDDKFMVGVAVTDTAKIKEFYNAFTAYLAAKHNLVVHKELRREKWLMPRVAPGCPIDYGKGRVLFVGEAAGFINPMGEGISAAIESGACAAEAVDACFDSPRAVTQRYRALTEDLHTYMIRQWHFTGAISQSFEKFL